MNDLFETKSKPIPITKDMVRQAYRKVRSNKGSAGVDEVSLIEFDENLSKNLYKLWNRLASGSYFPIPVKEVIIPKSGGGERKLGIPSINDRIAQEVVKAYLEPRLEAVFLPQSYGYRPNKSAHHALETVLENVRKYAWVIDMDIKRFFDEVDHELLMKAVDKHVPENWVKLYIRRWLESPIQTREGLIQRQGQGTPQGGVISPLLANLFLHYVLDKWLIKTYHTITFVRYADDIIVHCSTEKESIDVLISIRKRLEECKLRLNEDKTKITYCQDYRRAKRKDYPKKFDFLGHSFKPGLRQSVKGNGTFLGFNCELSMKSRGRIISEWKRSEFHRKSNLTLQKLTNILNTKSQGIINYYGKMNKTSVGKLFRYLDMRLTKWVKKKFKKLHSYKKARMWLRDLRSKYPNMFVHWKLGNVY